MVFILKNSWNNENPIQQNNCSLSGHQVCDPSLLIDLVSGIMGNRTYAQVTDWFIVVGGTFKKNSVKVEYGFTRGVKT